MVDSRMALRRCRHERSDLVVGGADAPDRANRAPREVLVAEMCSAFTCAELGIVPTVRHADYIGAWLDVLREDSRAIFRAASQASKAVDYLLAFRADATGDDRHDIA